MTDESFLQETNMEIWSHLHKSLHALLYMHDSQFCSQVEPFYIQTSSYLELIKSYCPVQASSYLLNKSVDSDVYKLKKCICNVTFCTRHVSHWPCYKINFALSLSKNQLTTDNSQLATDNSQLASYHISHGKGHLCLKIFSICRLMSREKLIFIVV